MSSQAGGEEWGLGRASAMYPVGSVLYAPWWGFPSSALTPYSVPCACSSSLGSALDQPMWPHCSSCSLLSWPSLHSCLHLLLCFWEFLISTHPSYQTWLWSLWSSFGSGPSLTWLLLVNITVLTCPSGKLKCGFWWLITVEIHGRLPPSVSSACDRIPEMVQHGIDLYIINICEIVYLYLMGGTKLRLHMASTEWNSSVSGQRPTRGTSGDGEHHAVLVPVRIGGLLCLRAHGCC